jgi:hypothetical protein
MLSFHTRVHALAGSLEPAGVITVAAQSIDTVRPATALETLTATFDEVVAALAELPRLDVEPDGFFTWTSATGPDDWKLEGQLVDAGRALMYVELKGTVPADVLDQVLTTLGWPKSRLLFELVREGVYVEEPGFRQWAGRGGPASH